jgi:hypothetical protein
MMNDSHPGILIHPFPGNASGKLPASREKNNFIAQKVLPKPPKPPAQVISAVLAV